MNTNKLKNIFLCFGLLILSLCLRLPTFQIPLLDVDEAQFAGYANALLSGGIPFIDSVDTKTPAIYCFYAIIFAIFGKNNMAAVHVITAFWIGCTAFIISKITNIISNTKTAVIAGIIYVAFSNCYTPAFASTSIASIMALPLSLNIYFLLKWEIQKKNLHLFLSGVAFGIACIFKYQAGINLFVIVIYFLLFFKESVKYLLIFFYGALSVAAIFLFFLFSSGAWREAWFYTFYGNIAYIAKNNSKHFIFEYSFTKLLAFIYSTAGFWILGTFETALSIKEHLCGDSIKNRHEILIILWCLLSFVAVSIGNRFYGHYFYQILPPLSILAALAVKRFSRWIQNKSLQRLKYPALALLFLTLFYNLPKAIFNRYNIDNYYKNSTSDYPQLYIPIAEYIKTHTPENEKIFVWGFATPIYFFSNRDSASRFLWCDWLTGRIAGAMYNDSPLFEKAKHIAIHSWELLFEDLAKNRPLYIIDTSYGGYHTYKKLGIKHYSNLWKYLQTHYVFETRVNGADIYKRNDTLTHPM